MKHKKVKLSVLLLGLGLAANAQQALTTTGGNSSSSGGSISYSVGQMVYKTTSSSIGSISQGVQQPFEISTVLGIENNSIHMELIAHPNPTNDFLTLNIKNVELSSLHFELYDINGKLIESRKILKSDEIIAMENLPNATYFLKVNNNKKELKIYKIIKN